MKKLNTILVLSVTPATTYGPHMSQPEIAGSGETWPRCMNTTQNKGFGQTPSETGNRTETHVQLFAEHQFLDGQDSLN